MKFHNATLYVMVIAGFILPVIAAAQPYTVDAAHPSASDSNPGTPDLPFRTLERGAEAASAGDTVFIKGIYHETLYTQNSGSPGLGPIVFAAAPGAQGVIDGSVGDPGGNGIVCTHAWIVFQGLEVRHWTDNGMWFEGGDNIFIRDCEVHQVAYGIGMTDGTHDFVLERVLMHHFDLYGFDVTPSSVGSSYNGTLIDCVSHTGRDPSQNVDGFALGHGDQHGFVLRNCKTWGVYDGFDISSRETTLEGCIAYDCLNGGFKLWQDEVLLVNCIGYNNGTDNVELDWDGNPGSVTLWNCTFHDAETYNIWVENSADSLIMYNCIVSGGDLNGLAFELQDAGNYFGDHNIFHNDEASRMINVGYEDQYTPQSFSAWQGVTGQDGSSIALSDIDNLYVNAAQYDLHLSATSPARDKGRTQGAPDEDYDGKPRPDGSAVDIGAYEFQSQTALSPFSAAAALSFTAYPNPTTGTLRFHIEADAPMPARLTIFDQTGKYLHRQYSSLSVGRNALSWDGRTDSGQQFRGICYAVLTTPFGMHHAMLILK